MLVTCSLFFQTNSKTPFKVNSKLLGQPWRSPTGGQCKKVNILLHLYYLRKLVNILGPRRTFGIFKTFLNSDVLAKANSHWMLNWCATAGCQCCIESRLVLERLVLEDIFGRLDRLASLRPRVRVWDQIEMDLTQAQFLKKSVYSTSVLIFFSKKKNKNEIKASS